MSHYFHKAPLELKVMTCVRKRQIHRDRKQISGCQEPGGGRKEDSLLMGTGCLLGVMKLFWNQIVVMVAEPCKYTKNH